MREWMFHYWIGVLRFVHCHFSRTQRICTIYYVVADACELEYVSQQQFCGFFFANALLLYRMIAPQTHTNLFFFLLIAQHILTTIFISHVDWGSNTQSAALYIVHYCNCRHNHHHQ